MRSLLREYEHEQLAWKLGFYS